MTPDLQASVVCEDVRVEMAGSHTVVGVLNAIGLPALPTRILKLCVWTRWCSGHGHFTQTTRLLSPDETALAQASTQFALESDESNAINVNIFGGVELSVEGVYHVEILIDNELKLRYPLRVFIASPTFKIEEHH